MPLSSWQGSHEERFQSKCEVLLAVPGPLIPRSFGGPLLPPQCGRRSGGLENELLHSLAGERTVRLQFRVSKYTRQHGLEACRPVSQEESSAWGQGGEGRTDEGRGGKRRTGSWRPWGPASARTFQKLMLAGKNSQFRSKSNHSFQNPSS